MECKECSFNNNGWCKKYKAQKPTAIKKCIDEAQAEKLITNQSYIVNGKVQEFHVILQQVQAKPDMVSKEFIEVLKTIYEMLEVEIAIHGFSSDFELDTLMLQDLRERMKQL